MPVNTPANTSGLWAASRRAGATGSGGAVSLPVINKAKSAIIKNFRCGDLMYGTSTGRDVNYLKKLEGHHKNNIVNDSLGANNEWARKHVRNTRSMVINSYSDPVRGALSDEFDRLKRHNGGAFKGGLLGRAINQAKIGRPESYGFDFESYGEIAAKHDKLKI